MNTQFGSWTSPQRIESGGEGLRERDDDAVDGCGILAVQRGEHAEHTIEHGRLEGRRTLCEPSRSNIGGSGVEDVACNLWHHHERIAEP